MNSESALQPVWDVFTQYPGEGFFSTPAFLLAAVILGVYLPGIVFSLIDAYTGRLSLRQSLAVYWRAMKWYQLAYPVLVLVFVAVPMPFRFEVPAEAPSVAEFFGDLVLYFLVGDFASYVWHRLEHEYRWYARNIHFYHHADKPPLSIWTAMVVHPVEGFTVFLTFHIYGIVFPIHPLTFAIAAFALTAVTMITHCGYRIPVYDWFFARAEDHDLHHSRREPTNISVVLSVCDRLFGTYQSAKLVS
jgi:sterol desaturase/sphingolipid hydroxylase (fatty acid hydroxylase superfamily)